MYNVTIEFENTGMQTEVETTPQNDNTEDRVAFRKEFSRDFQLTIDLP